MLDFLSDAWLDFKIVDYLFPDISLCGKNKTTMAWGLFLVDTSIVLNCLPGHCQLLCSFCWVRAAACGTLLV